MPISEDPWAAKATETKATEVPPEDADCRKLLDSVLYGTGVDLKAVKGPRGQLLTKQEAKAQREALERYTAAAQSQGPRKTFLEGSPSQIQEVLNLALGKTKSAKEGAAPARMQAFSCLQELAFATPILIEDPLKGLIALHSDAKVGKNSLDAATAIVAKFTPKGHGVVQLVLPIPMKLIDDKNWKVRVVGLKLLPPCLLQMQHTTKQLSELLSRLLPQLLAGPLMEPRKEIQEAAKEVLEVIGTLVRNSEVNALSQDVVRAVADPATQKHTQDVLAKLGSTTFMNYIDAASLALLIPIMTRGLKEREQKSRKWSAQILGAIVTLVRDIEYLRPYLPTLLPMLKECAVDPTYEIQREAAKAFGMLTKELPDWSRNVLQPWVCDGILSNDLGFALGCAHSLSEVLLKLGRKSRDGFMDPIIAGARSPDGIERRGFLLLLDFVVEALKNEFVPYIRRAFPAMLAGVLPEPEDPGLKVCQAVISRFGASCPELLLPGLEEIFFTCQYEGFVFPTAMKHAGVYKGDDPQWLVREQYVRLFLQLTDKILDYRKYGQDMLTCEDCSTRKTREQIMVLLEVMKEDKNAQVAMQTKHVLRNCGGQPKVTKEIMPIIESKLLEMRMEPCIEPKRKVANSLLASLVEAGDIGGSDGAGYLAALPAAPELLPPPEIKQKGEAHKQLMEMLAAQEGVGHVEQTTEEEEEVDTAVKGEDRGATAQAAFAKAFPPGSWDKGGDSAEAARRFCETMATSVAVEALSSRGLFGELSLKVPAVASKYAEGAVSESEMIAAARAVARAVFGEDSLTEEDEVEGAELVSDTLLKVEDMMLMYGGGHLLLKNTVLEIRKNRRYGIIGHNGCGKTTLMKELQAGRVSGMPKDLRCIHVSDADLNNMKELEVTSSIDFVKKSMPEDGDKTAEEALIQVGFPTDMQEKNVAELSGGWRMRLLLARAMLRKADILLLDEPTNHLDVHAIEWLCKFLLSLKSSSILVISHDPHFLNAVCTDIVQYRDKKLVYYKGNFDAFKQANKISDDDADVLLAGNLSLDRERLGADGQPVAPASGNTAEETGQAGAETGQTDAKDEAKAAAAVDTILDEPKAAAIKLVFPIPGKLEGIRNNTKPVMEIKDVFFEYPGERGLVIKGVSARLNLGSRVALVGVNGAGKSTLLGLMCGELNPTEHDGVVGEVWQHHNLRLSFIAQHHMTSLGRWFESTPFTYMSYRFQNGWDEEAQRHLIEPKDEEEARTRKEKASVHGKYGKLIGKIVGRSTKDKKMIYEIQWDGMEDQKQNTFENLDKIRALGAEGIASACNLRIAAMSGGVDTRVCSRREIVKHVEQFGVDEEMCCNRFIGSFSAGQKSKLAIACAMWTKPHLLALDEPTNYLDQETVDSLARALKNFRGGVVVVTHSRDFIEKVCEEEWLVADGKVTVSKMVPDSSGK